MKQPKKLTRQMKIDLSRMGKNPDDYGYITVTNYSLVLFNKKTKKVEEIRY